MSLWVSPTNMASFLFTFSFFNARSKESGAGLPLLTSSIETVKSKYFFNFSLDKFISTISLEEFDINANLNLCFFSFLRTGIVSLKILILLQFFLKKNAYIFFISLIVWPL